MILLNGLSMVNGLGRKDFLVKKVIACFWIGELCMAKALENGTIGKWKFSALQKIIPKVGNKFKELLKKIYWNSTNCELYAYK